MAIRNYQNSAAQAVMKRIKNNGYFSIKEAKSEYHPRFVASMNKVAAEMVSMGKLIYYPQFKQYKKP